MISSLTIGVDVGGTKIAAGQVDATGQVYEQITIPTGAGTATELTESILLAIRRLLTPRVTAVGVGAAGLIDSVSQQVRFSPHLPWREEPVGRNLEAALGLPVVLENDATAAAHAESRFGAGHDVQDMVLVNLGTGIGGGLVLAGRVHRGRGMAGELGHQQLVPDGLPCECGGRGCWEQYASGRVLDRLAKAEVRRASLLGRDLVEAAGTAAVVSGHQLGLLAMAGQPEALVAVREVGRWLGIGLANLAAVLDPELFVIGGGVGRLGEFLLEPARETLATHLVGRGHRELPAVKSAVLGVTSGLVGAADLARIYSSEPSSGQPGDAGP